MKDYVIGVKLKGQNVVMKEIDAVKKAGAKLAKTNFTAKVGSGGGRASFAGVRNEINARKQLEREKRNADATRGVREMEKRNATTFKNRLDSAKSGAATGRDVLGSAMTSGVSSVASMLPGIGALFSASQSAVGSAAQDYVSGITSSKNIQLITANFQRAFGNAMDGAFKNSMFANRQNKAVYANLAEQGVKVSTLSDRSNVDILDKLAREQGVGSLEELFQRIQSGQLKEGGALRPGDISYAQSLGQGLNNRYSAEISMQGLLALFKSRKSEIEKVAGADYMAGAWRKDPKTGKMYRAGGLSNTVRAEGDIQETEQNYQAGAAATLGRTGYNAMQSVRLADLKLRARTVGLAAGVSKVQTEAGNQLADMSDDIEKGDWKKLGMRFVPGYIDPRAAERQGIKLPNGDTDGGGGEDVSGAGGGAPLSQSNSDITRAGSALADTLNKINSQLMAVQYQMRTRGG